MRLESEYLTRLINNPERAFTTPLNETDFQIEAYQLAFAELRNQIRNGIKPNVATIASSIPQYATELLSLNTVEKSNYDHFEEVMIERVINLRIRKAGEEMIRRASSGETSETLLPWLAEIVSECNVGENVSKLTTFYDYAMKYGPIIEEKYRAKGKLIGVLSGFSRLDALTGGFQPAVYFIGARPSHGKTALLLTMLRAALNNGVPAAMISLESSQNAIVGRVLSSEGPIKMTNIMDGNLRPKDFNSLADTFVRMKKWNGYLVFDPKSKLSDIERHCTTLVKAAGVKIIFIDYLQRISAPGFNKTEQVGNACRAITDMTRTLNIPIVCMAQTGRQADKEAPAITHFQHNSQIEQDADVAMIIHHKVIGEEGPEQKISTHLAVLKNRDGEVGDVPVIFDGDHVRFLMDGER